MLKTAEAIGSQISAREINIDDWGAVSNLLGFGLGYDPKRFLRILEALKRRPKLDECPQYGVLLEIDSEIVGTLLTVYSKIEHADVPYIRCHLTGWYVKERFSMYGALLVKVALSRPDVCYVNLSARQSTFKIIKAQGFRIYSKGQNVIFCLLHALDRAKGASICTRTPLNQDKVRREELELVNAHEDFGCMTLWIERHGKFHPFVLRRKNIKGVIPAAQVIYCRTIDDIGDFIGPISRFLLMQGIVVLLFDGNGPCPGLRGIYVEGLEPRFSRGITPRIGDLAYTLNALVPFERQAAIRIASIFQPGERLAL